MAAYIHGNLAVEERTGKKVRVREKRSVVYRSKALPLQEKLLYLLTMVVCVVLAGLIIWRYAQIYEVNTKIQKIENQIETLQNENKKLKLEVNRLQDPKRLIEKAKELGLRPSNENEIKGISDSNIAEINKKVAFNR
ncbi:cell division protein FtsL [Ferviditalea candida]|uniref:Cell division protein FtsL n=1 Tax=Ferviditalea candida TaxID=3108399 RepID=A0ABU5ZFH5_9BACL|nr:cell division protein FtsL [Paenibacillaceae bacterium T2]